MPFPFIDDSALTGDLENLRDDIEFAAGPRQFERRLLIAAGAFVLTNHVTLIIAQHRSPLLLWHMIVWALAALLGLRMLDQLVPRRDPLLFPLAMFLTGWGLNLIARLVPGSFAARQTLWMVVGLVVLLVVTALPGNLRWLRRYRYTWLIGGLALLALTILIGQNPSGGGPRLWLWAGFGRVYYQPSELLKIALVAFLASYLAEHQPYLHEYTVQIGRSRVPSPVFVGPVLLMWGVCMVVLVWQQDLGAATLFFVVAMVMLYIASGQAKLLLGGTLLLLIAAAVAYRLFDVVALRFDVWWNPWPTANSDAYQVVQSLMAVSAGGVFGQGIGLGQPAIIPVVHSDFAFAAIAEEWGLLGVVGVVGALAVLAVRGMRIAARAQQPFRVLLAAGLSLLLAGQSLLIMGGVLKLIPLTGVTLPFVSYGGSSLLTNFVIVGLLLVLSHEEADTWPES